MITRNKLVAIITEYHKHKSQLKKDLADYLLAGVKASFVEVTPIISGDGHMICRDSTGKEHAGKMYMGVEQ